MPKQRTSSYSISWVRNISEIDRNAWDALAKPLSSPFLEWDWLRLMEISGSTTARTGWIPHHLAVWSGRDLVAAAPMYIKTHSGGEFVFDHVWADVADHLKIKYYPKLVGMSPFTPMFGYRFLIAAGEDESSLTAAMVAEVDRWCHRYNISGSSFLFVDPQWQPEMISHNYYGWRHQSFVWLNQEYKSFEDYLSIFNSNQRRNIKRERKAIDKQEITIKIFKGPEIPQAYFPLMYTFYQRTNDKFGPWGCRYLTEAFFEGLYHHYRHRLVFVAAFDKNEPATPMGMSLLATKGKQLYGRYWGCIKPVNSLHFNACYYAPIEWAIHHGIHRFDPGAGGAHKIRRGFTAIGNYSLHRFYDSRLLQIMQTHIDDINRLEQEQIEALNNEIPFAQRVKN